MSLFSLFVCLQVPSIEIDGVTLSQSIAILEYLEETRPQVPILPKGAVERARVGFILFFYAENLTPNSQGRKKQGKDKNG